MLFSTGPNADPFLTWYRIGTKSLKNDSTQSLPVTSIAVGLNFRARFSITWDGRGPLGLPEPLQSRPLHEVYRVALLEARDNTYSVGDGTQRMLLHEDINLWYTFVIAISLLASTHNCLLMLRSGRVNNHTAKITRIPVTTA